MIINNKELSARVRLGFMMYVLVYLVLLVFSIVFSWSAKHHFELVLSIIFVLGLIFFFIRGYKYIYFNTEGSKIILRYMGLQPLLYGNHAIEIPKSKFVKYKIKKDFFGLRHSIILYQNTEKGLSKYPPVSLSSLKKSEKRDMLEILDKIKNL